MAFPVSPTIGQEYTIGTHTYEWNGTAWDIAGSTTASAISDKADITYVDSELATKLDHNDTIYTSGSKVGIGVGSPDEKLEVSGDIKSGGAGFGIYHFGDASDVTKIIGRDNSHATLPSTMDFYTNSSTRMRIDSTGTVFVGKTGHSPVNSGVTLEDQANVSGRINLVKTASGAYAAMKYYYNSTSVGSITYTDTSTAYNTSSDYRLKEDIQELPNATTRLMALNPCNFAWKVDGSRVDGFIAHEAQEIVPEAVSGTKDAMREEEYEVTPAVYETVEYPAVEATYDEEGNILTEAQEAYTEEVLITEAVMGTREVPDYQGIDQAKLVPLLTKALQEAVERIEALEAKVNAV